MWIWAKYGNLHHWVTLLLKLGQKDSESDQRMHRFVLIRIWYKNQENRLRTKGRVRMVQYKDRSGISRNDKIKRKSEKLRFSIKLKIWNFKITVLPNGEF